MSKDRKIIIAALILLALAAGGYFYINKTNPEFFKKFTTAQTDAIRVKAEKYINENLVAPGTQAKIKDITEENGLYKISVTVGSQDVTAYISKDGKNFFPQVFNMDGAAASATPSVTPPPTVSKTDVPQIELFVMSYCPYGLQMEKGILPVVDLLGSKIKFDLKFVGYAMHGDKEIQENMRQYCVGQQGLDKLSAYLKCFTQQDDANACLGSAKINQTSLNTCVAATDAQFKITATAKDQASWKGGQYPPFPIYEADNVKYNISGSPSLVINGTQVSAQRDSQSLSTLICSAFSNQPGECRQQLSTSTPAAGFGTGTGSGSNSSCGN